VLSHASSNPLRNCSSFAAKDELKLAEKIKSDLKVGDRRFAWLRTRALVDAGKWTELKKLIRMKRPPLPPAPQVVRLIRESAGETRAKEFLTEEFVANHSERFDLFAEFGMFLEAANAAFVAKSLESLTSLEAMAAGRDDILRSVATFKAKLLAK